MNLKNGNITINDMIDSMLNYVDVFDKNSTENEDSETKDVDLSSVNEE